MSLIYKTRSAEETLLLGKNLAQKLSPGMAILLFGDLGSGKTQLTKGIAQGLGVEAKIKSPTFAYVNKFPIYSNKSISGYFYHYDLYRLNVGDDTDSIGLEDSLNDPYAINVVEWADRLTNLPPQYIRVEILAKKNDHQFKIMFIDPEIPNDKQIRNCLTYFLTPLHVRKHMKQVANVAMQIAKKYADINQIINSDLLYKASILHDVARVCDFRTLDKSNFQEEISDKKLSRWLVLRKEYKNIPHPKIAQDFLTERGFKKTANLIYSHGSRTIVQEPERLDSLEAKILYYADKRVKHDEIVSLKERFEDGKKRYGRPNDVKTAVLFKEVEKMTFLLEKELFAPLSLIPEQIL